MTAACLSMCSVDFTHPVLIPPPIQIHIVLCSSHRKKIFYCEKLCESVFASSLNMKDNTMIKNNYYKNTHNILRLAA